MAANTDHQILDLALEKYLDSGEYELAEDAVFHALREAFKAGWMAARAWQKDGKSSLPGQSV